MIKSKRFTRTMALLLAVLTVFSILPVSALAVNSDNTDNSVAPDVIIDENGDIVTSKRLKAPARAGDSGGGSAMGPIYGPGGYKNPKAGDWGESVYFIRYTLARITGEDILRDDVYGNESGMASQWNYLADAALNNVNWTISVNAGMDGNPTPFNNPSNLPYFSSTTNAFEYERILRNAGSFKNARQELCDYLYGPEGGDGHLLMNPRLNQFYFTQNGMSGGMPNFIGVSSGTDGMAKLFAGSNSTRLVNGAHVLDASAAKTATVGDKLLAYFFEMASTGQRTIMRNDARTNLENQGKTEAEINEIMSKASYAEIASLAFTCTGSGFCYRVIAEPGCVCTNAYDGGRENFGAFTFRDVMTIAYIEATRSESPRTPSSSNALCRIIANTGIALTPTKNELLMAHYGKDPATGEVKIDDVYDSESGSVASPFPKDRNFKSVGTASVTGSKIYDEVINNGNGNTFKGYGVGVWAGFQNGSVPNTTTTITVRKIVNSNFEEYVNTAKFTVNVVISGLQSTPSSLVGTTYENGNAVRNYTGMLSGGTLTFNNVELKNGYTFELAKDFLDTEKTSNVKVTVTETGETDGKFNALFPACATYIGVPQQTNDCTDNGRTFTAQFVGKNGLDVTITNELQGVMVEKEVDASILDNPDLGVDENFDWPFYIGFNINDEAYSGTAYYAKFAKGGSTPVKTGTEAISKDSQFLFTLKHGERIFIASTAFAKASAQGKWMYYGMGEQNVPELADACKDAGKTWVVGFYPSGASEEFPYTETYLFADAEGNKVDAEEMPEGGGYYRHRDFSGGTQASVKLTNANDKTDEDPDGVPVHMLVDYNINGQSASTSTGSSTNIAIKGGNNPIDCGTLKVGQKITVKLGDGTTPLAKEQYLFGPDANGNYVKAIYDGVWTEASGGTKIADASTTEFEWTVPSTYNGVKVEKDQLITLYVHWRIEGHLEKETITVPGGGGDNFENYKIFPVYFNYNYTGGGSMAIECGKFEIWHRLDKCTLLYGPDGIYGHTYPNEQDYTKVQVVFGFEDPHKAISGETLDGTIDRQSLRVGWTFMGWTKDPDKWYGEPGGERFNTYENCIVNGNESIVHYYSDEVREAPTESTTYYALWLPKPIYWYANSGWFTQKSGDNYSILLEGGKPKTMIKQTSGVRSGGHYYVDIMGAEKNVPKREGYQFNGWYFDPDCMIPILEFETGLQPGRSYWAGWTPNPVYVNYHDTREGGKIVTTQEYVYGDSLKILPGIGDTDGQTFQDWTIGKDGASATTIRGLTNEYYYSAANNKGMTAKNQLLTYHPRTSGEEGSDYTGGDYGGSNTSTSKDHENSIDGNGYWTLDLYSKWGAKTASYTATVDWSDFTNNDGVRPKAVTIGLLSSVNDKTVATHTFRAEEFSADANVWQYTFTGLDITTSDNSVEEITYKIYPISYVDCNGKFYEIKDTAATSGKWLVGTPSKFDTSTSTEYRFGINNYLSVPSGSQDGVGAGTRLYAGKISLEHDLITTGDDIKFTINWDDKSDNDGKRPGSVTLVLLADGVPVLYNRLHNAYTGYVNASAAICDVTKDGDVWTYTFMDYQKFTDQGRAINYTVSVVNMYETDFTATYTQNGYDATYLTGSQEQGDPIGVTLHREIELTDVPLTVVWDDENNRDGTRPDSVVVELRAYQWNRKDFCWETQKIANITLTGDPTATEWTHLFRDEKVYHGGEKRLYMANVVSDLNAHIEAGANGYGWTQGDVGNPVSVIISHNKTTKNLPVTIQWSDDSNNDAIRPDTIVLQLYADGVRLDGELNRVVLSGSKNEDIWTYEFKNLPRYRAGDSGKEIVYTIGVEEAAVNTLYGKFVAMPNGYEQEIVRYVASYRNAEGGTTDKLEESAHAYVMLTHNSQQGSVTLSVSWEDDQNRDSKRPSSVLIDLYKQVGNARELLETVNITANRSGTWNHKFTGLPIYENGEEIMYVAEVHSDTRNELKALGYTCAVEGRVVHMYYTPEKGSVSTQIHWIDNDNNDHKRPDHVKVALYANGVLVPDSEVELNALNNWSHTWTDLTVYYRDKDGVGNKNMYSVKVADDVAEYIIDYVPETTAAANSELLYINLTHSTNMTEVPVSVYWNDNNNSDGKRPDEVKVQLYANGEPVANGELTVSGTAAQNVWTAKYENMPKYADGREVVYTVQVSDDIGETYTVMAASTNLYLSYKPETGTLYVSFRFEDANNADGKRPSGGYLQLQVRDENNELVDVDMANAEHSIYFEADGMTKDYFYDLPVNQTTGKPFYYSVKVVWDDEIFGGSGSEYAWTASKDVRLSSGSTNQLVITAKREADTGTETGHIYWFDNNNVCGNRPDFVEINLFNNRNSSVVQYRLNIVTGEVTRMSNGEVVGSVTASEWGNTGNASVWTYTISGLQQNTSFEDDHEEIFYSINVLDTGLVNWYKTTDTTRNGMNANLTHVNYGDYIQSSKQDYSVTVNWLDNDNAWGYRPETTGLMLSIHANGAEEAYQTVRLTKANAIAGNDSAWTYTFTDLPTYNNGEGVTWTVRLADSERYTQHETFAGPENAIIDMTQTVSFDFAVNWNDVSNNDNKRPESLDLEVRADGETVRTIRLTGDGDVWTAKAENLPVWRVTPADTAVQYTFAWTAESAKALSDNRYNARATSDGVDVDSSNFYYLSATEWGKGDDTGLDTLSGAYKWETTLDYNKLTKTVTGTVKFKDNFNQDGKRPDKVMVQLLADGKPCGEPVAVTGASTEAEWFVSWKEQDIYNSGSEIVYTIEITDTPDGYTLSMEDNDTVIVLTHEIEKVDVSGTLTWLDGSDLHEVRNADGVLLRTYGQIERKNVFLQLVADGEDVEGAVYEFTVDAYGEGERLIPNLTHTFEGLDRYEAEGREIVYTTRIYSDGLDELLENGRHIVTTDTSKTNHSRFVIKRQLFDVSGTVWYLYDVSDEFLLPNVPVTAYFWNKDDNTYTAVGTGMTDAHGHYEIKNVPNGNIIVRATYQYGDSVYAGTKPLVIDRMNGTADIVVDRDSKTDSDLYFYSATGKAFYQTDVTDKSTITPVPEGSVVLLYRVVNGQTDVQYVTMSTTDANGGYKFTELTSGSYLINVVFNYNDGTYTYDNADAVRDGKSFNITGADAKWPDVVKQVNPVVDPGPVDPGKPDEPDVPDVPESTACELSGYVFFSDNGAHTTTPVINADVHLYTGTGNVEVARAVTDDNGQWTMTKVPAGDYIAVFSYQGNASRVLRFTVTDADFEAGKMTVDTQYFDRTVKEPTSVIRGVVLSENGERCPALVQIINEDGDIIDFAYTDDAGVYSFTVVSGYTYGVRILEVGSRTETLTAGDPDMDNTTLDYYKVSGNFNTNGTIQAGVTVIAYKQVSATEFQMLTATLTDANGNYSLKLTEAGNYKLALFRNGQVFEERMVTVGYQEWEPALTENTDGTYRISGVEAYDAIELYDCTSNVVKKVAGSDQAGSSYDFDNLAAGKYYIRMVKGTAESFYYVDAPDTVTKVEHFVTVSGKATDIYGNPALGAIVSITDASGNKVGADTLITDGYYSYSGLTGVGKGGEGYTISITYPVIGKTLADKTTEDVDSYRARYPDGITEGSEWVWNINASAMSGRVTDQNGKPIEGAAVVARNLNDPNSAFGGMTRTDSNGEYVIGVPSGSYEVEAVYELDAEHLYRSTETKQVTVSGEDVTDTDFIINRYRLSGTVVRDDASKAPIAGAKVTITVDGVTVWTGITDLSGKFATTLMPDNYTVSAASGDAEAETVADLTADAEVSLELSMPFALTGTVTDSSGRAVPDAIVHYTSAARAGTVYTDDDGVYRLTLTAPDSGFFTLWAEAAGARSGEVKVYVDKDRTVDLELNPVEDAEFDLSGIVTDNEGNRLGNSVVTLVYGNDKTQKLTTSTSSSGAYHFTVPEGTFYLSAEYTSDAGYKYSTNAEQAVHVTDTDLTNINLAIALSYEVKFIVKDTTGAALANANIDYMGAASGSVMTGADGTVTANLAGGRYDMTASVGNRSLTKSVEIRKAAVIEFVLGTTGLSESKPEVNANTLTISGTVLGPDGKPIKGAVAELFLMNEETLKWESVKSTVSDADGYYEFTDLKDGRYRVDVSYTLTDTVETEAGRFDITGYAMDDEDHPYVDATVELYNADGHLYQTVKTDAEGYYEFLDVPNGKYTVKIIPNGDEGDRTQTSEVESTPGTTVIEGVATDVNGKPVTGAVVTVRSSGGDEWSMTTDASGEYRFELPEGGTYEVAITYPDSWQLNTDNPKYDPDDKNQPTVNQDGYTISGVVLDTDGNPVKGAEVILKLKGEDKEAGRTVTEADGRYEFTGLRPGEYEVTVIWGEAEKGYDVDTGSGIVNPKPDVEPDDPTPGKMRVSGTVVTNHGRPVAGAVITVTNADSGESYELTADSNGRFDTGDIAPGRYGFKAAYTHDYATNSSDTFTTATTRSDVALVIVLSYTADVNGDGETEQVFAGDDDEFDTPDDFYETDIEPDGVKEKVFAGEDGNPGTKDDYYPYDVNNDGEDEKVFVGEDRTPGTADDYYETDPDADGEDEPIYAGTDGIPGTEDDWYPHDVDGDGEDETVHVGPDAKPGTSDDYYDYDVDNDGTAEKVSVGKDGIPGTPDDFYERDINNDGEPEKVMAGADGLPGTKDDYYELDVDDDGKPEIIHVGEDGKAGTPDDYYEKDVNGDGKDETVYVGPDGIPGTEDDWYLDENGEKQPVGVWVRFDANGGVVNGSGSHTIKAEKLDRLPSASRASTATTQYTFAGWFTEKIGGAPVTINALRSLTKTTVVYAHWTEKSIDDGPTGGGGGSTVEKPDAETFTVTFASNGGSKVSSQTVKSGDKAQKPADPTYAGHKFIGWMLNGKPYDFNAPVKADITLQAEWEYTGLLRQDHTAYIAGYETGMVCPDNNMTRAEAAMMFYRLLRDDVRAQYTPKANVFTDVSAGAWYADAVSVLAEMGIINGIGDNMFAPNKPITRAEFATIAARFDKLETTADMPFSDVSTKHWAHKYIASAAAKGWINGYGDGTFGPDNTITRAQVITLVNRVLGRHLLTHEGLITSGMKTFPDNADTSAWYYLAIQEATNSHKGEIADDVETWTELTGSIDK